MATEMTAEELEAELKGSVAIDTYEHRSDDSEDDYIIASLHRTPQGRHFRYVESTGMNSDYAGASEFGEWLDADEVATWTQF